MIKHAILLIALVFFTQPSFCQARSGIGFGTGINKPFTAMFEAATGLILHTDVKITDRSALSIIGDMERFIPKSAYRIDDERAGRNFVGYVGLGIHYRRYMFHNLFLEGGPNLCFSAGDRDVMDISLGGTLAIGYTFPISRHHAVNLAVDVNYLRIDYNRVRFKGFLGGKAAYSFRF
ncbi:DUF3575 domain-containing protein [Hufsiella ginkgonis]|uniref:DUF3575 domain-containing protein n=1 Tax=Hufsiella ginkgonis TaxID=2695274 RepID=A0A7K1XVY5_9SPHI|nr:DUF3575 domain-containing protein [Hufsiella ginkgonis]MXV14686.1 DUF3575 domain-containing protein [Hufsiella ginkgonis]